MKPLLLALAASLLGGCLYTDVRSPRAYRSATPSELKTTPTDAVLTGSACNQYFLYLVALGDGGYHAAVKKALQGQPPETILYDVKTDVKVTSVLLGLYTRTCTNVQGRAGKA
jgi:hypothetical protein